MGNIIASSTPVNFNEYWNQVTPENAGKWGSVEPTRDVMNWAQLDAAYQHAINNGYPFKQHTFVWNNQKPGWIDALTDAEIKEEVEEWIKLYGERYTETAFIDVVNEPLHAAPTFKAALGGAGTSGYDWIVWSFEKARQYNPTAKLLLNDYNILKSTFSNNTVNPYLQIINILKERNLIDGIGVQGHFMESTPNAIINENLDKLAATGLPIYVSEYDINIADDSQQLNVMKQQFPLIYQHPGVEGVTFWGYRQGNIWRQDAYLIRSNGTERPALEWLRTYLLGRCSGVLSLDDKLGEDNELISIYPNPVVHGSFTIEFSGSIEQLVISDLSGKIVHHQFLNGKKNNSISVSAALSPGIYFVKAKSDNHTSVKKMLVN